MPCADRNSGGDRINCGTFLQAVSEIEDISCAAVYSRSEARGRRLAAKFGVTKVYTDFGQMLADDGVNWIYIASPNSLHYEQARRSLEMGKHVICEKPFTSTSAEAADLMDRAKKNGGACFCLRRSQLSIFPILS